MHYNNYDRPNEKRLPELGSLFSLLELILGKDEVTQGNGPITIG